MIRKIIEIPRGSTPEARKIEKLRVAENTLIKSSGLQIGVLIIDQPAGFSGRDNFLCELRGNDCQIGRITIIGCASDEGTKEQWNNQVASGLHVTGNDNVIGQSFNERVHIPYLATGRGNKLARLYAELASGDGFNLCNHGNDLYLADFVSMITTFPYEIYHPDVGMMYHKEGLTLHDCNAYNVNYHLTGHRWEDPERQGFLSDNKTLNCGIINFVLPGVHPEHGCSWADAINCTTMNLVTNGAVSFDRKSKITIASAARENNYV